MQRLYLARDRIEAQILRDILDRHLIDSVVLGDYLAGAAGELPADIYPTLWVIEDRDLGRAQELLARYLTPPADAPGRSPWVCLACGETVEGDFDLCWNCSRPKD